MQTKVSQPESDQAHEALSVFTESVGQRLLARVSTDLVTAMVSVNAARRQAIRAEHLISGRRAIAPPSPALFSKAISEWGAALGMIAEFADLLTSSRAIAEMDAEVAQVNDPTRPEREILALVATQGMGFPEPELQWMLAELSACGFDCLWLMSGGEPRILQSISRAAATGDGGLMQVGFLNLTDKDDVNRDVQFAFARARSVGMTLSVFHFLPAMVLAAARFAAGKTTISRAAASVNARYGSFREAAN